MKTARLFLVNIFYFSSLILLWTVAFIPAAFSQVKNRNQQILDSLLVVNKTLGINDSTKLDLWLSIHRQYVRLNDEVNSIHYVSKIIPITQQLRKPLIAGTVYNRMGLFYHGRSEVQNSEKYYLLAIESYNEANRKDLAAGTYLNLGALYSLIPDYGKSLAATQNAIEIYLENGELGDLASCYANIANIYIELHQESKALPYLKKALPIFLTFGENSRGVNVVYNAMGLAYLSASQEELRKMEVSAEQRFNTSLEYLNKALKIAEAIKDDDLLIESNLNLGLIYEAMGDRVRALEVYTRAYTIGKKNIDKNDQANTMLSLGKYYENQQQAESALKYFEEALSIGMSNNLSDVQQKAYAGISTAYERLGDYSRSLDYYRKYVQVKDAIFNQEKEREFTRKQLQIDFAVKEKDYQVKQLKTDADLQRQVLLASQQQQLLTLREQKLALVNKEKELQRLTFLQKEAELQNQKILQQKAFENAKLTSELKSAILDRRISKQGLQIQLDQKVKWGLVITVLLSLCIALVVYYNQRRTRRLNSIISEQKSELEQLGKVKNKIFSVVSHDMRGPVNSVISFMQLLEGQNITQEKLTLYAASLKDNLHHTSTMMENLLNWAASQMEGFSATLVPVNISEVVVIAMTEVSVKAANKKINIQTSVMPTLTCLADSDMLLVVIRNLLNNALKFTSNGGIVSLSAIAKGDYIQLEISDSGVGMSDELVRHFNKEGAFLGGGQTTLGTNKEKGTGLGLMLCRTFTDIMGGTIKVSSKPNEGTTFHLTFKRVG